MKYYQRVEGGYSNITLKVMERFADVLQVPPATLLDPPRQTLERRKGRPKKETSVVVNTEPAFTLIEVADGAEVERAVPLISIHAAAGNLSETSLGEIAAWVIPNTQRAIEPGMFVARVSGRSMEPTLPDGCYCLFKTQVPEAMDGQVMLIEHRSFADPDTGGNYAVKRVRFERRGQWVNRLILQGDNPSFEPIRIDLNRPGLSTIRIIALMVCRLGA